MATLTRQDLNFGQGKLQLICKFTARYSFNCSCCWHSVWVFGSGHSPHPLCQRSVSVWHLSEKEEI